MPTLESRAGLAGEPLYNIFVDYCVLGEGGRAESGLSSYQTKELLEDCGLAGARGARAGGLWSRRCKATQERVHDTRGAITGGHRLQFAGLLQLLLEASRDRKMDLHALVHQVRTVSLLHATCTTPLLLVC